MDFYIFLSKGMPNAYGQTTLSEVLFMWGFLLHREFVVQNKTGLEAGNRERSEGLQSGVG